MTYVNGGSVLAIAILFIALSIAAVIARFSVRRRKSGLGIDDWLCLLALVNSPAKSTGSCKNAIQKLMICQALVIADGTIMIIGNRNFL